MQHIEYIFERDKIIHVLSCKPSANRKLGLGYMVHTYHFSIEQVETGDFTLDSRNCLDCPYSYNMNMGKSGGCYTHKGLMYSGLKSMLKRLHRLWGEGKIQKYSKSSFDGFIKASSFFAPALTRLGVYGEPSTIPLNVIKKLVELSKKHTGYTHQWNLFNKKYSRYLMASTHSAFESRMANNLGWRSFESSRAKELTMPTCPAAKEFTGNKLTCVTCGACNGKIGGKNNIHIVKH